LRVVFMGSPEFAIPSLEGLVRDGYEVAAVYTRPDKPAGRGRNPAYAPVKAAALALGLPVVQPPKLRVPEVLAALAALRPDVVVVAAYGLLLPPEVLAVPRQGAINVHPSLLPRWRGASPVAAAILSGDEFTGVSIMLLDAGLDTGPVLSRAQVPVSPQDDAGSLTGKLARVGAALLNEVLAGWSRDEITPRTQDEAGATLCRPITKEDGEIDWHAPARDIWRRVRAFQPWPGGYTRWRGKKLDILEAWPLAAAGAFQTGEIVPLAVQPPPAGLDFGIATGEGVLGIARVRLEGKRDMTAAEFRRGQRDFIGARLPD
jgi:methionyl-tRNA formyltransferase